MREIPKGDLDLLGWRLLRGPRHTGGVSGRATHIKLIPSTSTLHVQLPCMARVACEIWGDWPVRGGGKEGGRGDVLASLPCSDILSFEWRVEWDAWLAGWQVMDRFLPRPSLFAPTLLFKRSYNTQL